MRSDWAEKLSEMAEKDEEKFAQSASAFVQENRERIKIINIKLQRLLDGYLAQDIEREIYRQEKQKLFLEKKSLEEKIIRIEQRQNDWLKPMEKWINYAQNIEKIARDNEPLFGEPVFPYKAPPKHSAKKTKV